MATEWPAQLTEFEWDDGNSLKNWVRHNISMQECEEAFFNLPLYFAPDFVHSETEERYYILGQTDRSRKIFIAFTIRGTRIRVISARDMSRKEREVYSKL